MYLHFLLNKSGISCSRLHTFSFSRGKRGFISRRLVLFSDVGGEFGDDQLKDIVASMKEYEVDFNVMYAVSIIDR